MTTIRQCRSKLHEYNHAELRTCPNCEYESRQAWYWSNRERILKVRRKWTAKNRDKVREHSQRWRDRWVNGFRKESE